MKQLKNIRGLMLLTKEKTRQKAVTNIILNRKKTKCHLAKTTINGNLKV